MGSTRPRARSRALICTVGLTRYVVPPLLCLPVASTSLLKLLSGLDCISLAGRGASRAILLQCTRGPAARHSQVECLACGATSGRARLQVAPPFAAPVPELGRPYICAHRHLCLHGVLPSSSTITPLTVARVGKTPCRQPRLARRLGIAGCSVRVARRRRHGAHSRAGSHPTLLLQPFGY